jgi:uncharacterized protein YndB with AHSA1/START domain
VDALSDKERPLVKTVGEAEITTPNDRQIVIMRYFDAPPATVFDAWTKADNVARWWDPNGIPLAACEIDLRPDGLFRWVHRGPNGEEGHIFAGAYLEIVRPKRLVFSVKMFQPGQDPVATLSFVDEGRGTKMTMVMECKSAKDRDAMLQMRIDEGTAKTLGNLATYLPRMA